MTKRLIITGLSGTVAPVVAKALRPLAWEIIGWDRSKVPETDFDGSRAFLDDAQPDAVFHIGMGPPAWAALMAAWCREHDRRLLFTSTVSVFSGATDRPYTVHSPPDATDDYGRYKQACEQAIAAADPSALIVRIGWQIGDRPGSNNMVDFLERSAVDGTVALSWQQFPGCSFLEDTARALVTLHTQERSGLFHLDGNPGLSLYEIARRLSRLHGDRWRIRPVEEPRSCSLMADDRVDVTPITARLQRVPDR